MLGGRGRSSSSWRHIVCFESSRSKAESSLLKQEEAELGACTDRLSYSWREMETVDMSVRYSAVTGIVDEKRVRPASCSCWTEGR